ncbi:lysR family protein regulatory helix-turn-helix protein [Escherichia coli H489]|nr:lysR family protein regulatory helix-turn-helix protein [Escherichia coli H489]
MAFQVKIHQIRAFVEVARQGSIRGASRMLNMSQPALSKSIQELGNDSNLLIVFYVQIMPDDFVMQLHRF